MKYTLKRLSDRKGDSGQLSQAIQWNLNGSYSSKVSNRPTIGCSMLVGSIYARTNSTQDFWLTTPIIEIIKEIKDENFDYVRFRTENSEYEWWINDYPDNLDNNYNNSKSK